MNIKNSLSIIVVASLFALGCKTSVVDTDVVTDGADAVATSGSTVVTEPIVEPCPPVPECVCTACVDVTVVPPVVAPAVVPLAETPVPTTPVVVPVVK